MSYPVSSMSFYISRHLLVGVASLAIAGSAFSRPAAAQSFQGTPTVTVGGATVNTSPNNTTVNVNAPVTVINWRPDDRTGTGSILFQPAGTTALFRSINGPDFTVLNRVLPVDINGAPVITRPIRFDGTVNSQFGISAATAAGSIWFYTPGGIILGSGSAFNVGSLVLSTSDINPANIFVGNNGTINFTGTPNTASAITLESGAQVNALINGSSYVAMVAPRIVQNGTIRVDGSAALVGAEAVDITMNGPSGLFNITVSTGTSDANGVVHGDTGSTTGPASTGAGDAQRIYMMAIPKNTAISMLVNGNVGYAPAATATVQNGEVILSAGYDIANGTMNIGEHATPVNNIAANITIGETSNFSTSFSSLTLARASGNLFASPGASVNGPGFLTFSSSAFLLGDLSSVVQATANEVIGVGGDLFVTSRRAGQGGNASVSALGGLIGVGGDLTIDAGSIGFSGQTSGISLSNLTGGVARGGNASLRAANGTLRISGATQVSARGVGGYGTQSMGTGFGGTAAVNLSGTATQAQLTGGLDVQGGGYGILSYLALLGANVETSGGFNGANGVGGSASVFIDDISQLTLPTLAINALGVGDIGGTETDGPGGNGGSGTGGAASFTLNNEALALPELAVVASGFGGNGARTDDPTDLAGNGGAGIGGTAAITLTGTASFTPTADFVGAMVAVANGRGGSGGDAAFNSASDSGSGGAGSGGTARISIGGASRVNVATLAAFANATSGFVGTGSPNFGGTGAATGGNVSIAINTSATVNVSLLSATANAITVETSRTGNATAGTANVTVSNGTVTVDEVNVFADAYLDTESGQNVGSANAVLVGTNAGGAASLSVSGGSLAANRVFITATGVGTGQQRDSVGDADENSPIEQVLAGGVGAGGQATFSISSGTANFAETLLIDASGKGGNGYINDDNFATQPATSGAGGAGVGGIASLNVTGGLLTVPAVDLKSEGTGGNGGDFWGLNAGDAGSGGNGTGGATNFTAAQDVFTINTLTLSALGRGGTGSVSADVFLDGFFIGYGDGAATGGAGGIGRGGNALLSLDFDPVLPSLIIDTSGIGGAGGLGLVGGNGGNGFGGSGLGGARLALNFGDLTVDDLILRSNGTGGDGGQGTGGPGGAGGNGTGGDAELLANGSGSNLTTLDVLVQTNGLGGNAGIGGGTSNGVAGGNAQGGNARLTISNAATGNLGATVIEAIANGGIGSDGPAGLSSGDGGNAIGGNAALAVTAASVTSTDILVQANGSGGSPGIGGSGGDGTGGGASLTATTGSFSANDTVIMANGRGGTAGGSSTGGTAAISSIGGSISFITTSASAEGETGSGSGGLVSILTGANASGTSGVMNLGASTLNSDALGGVAGIVRINNNNGDAAGGVIQFSQLFASADGLTSTNPAGGVYIRANQSDILVTGTATLFARDTIGIDGIGQGTFAANGNVFATAGTDIVITHSGQPGLVDTVRGTILSLSAGRNLDAQSGSIIRGTNFVDAQATNGFANVDQLFAANTSVVAAGTDASIRNATITNGSLNLWAGRIFGNAPTWRRATATILGAVSVSDALLVNSGGDIVTNEATISTGNNVVFNAGDDIIIRNSSISSAQNVTTSGEIQLNAGAITPVNALPGEIHSLVVANSALTSTGYDLLLTADAIDATSAVINANRLTALVNNAPAPGTAGGNDGGLLAANCVQGNICLGAVNTPTQILVGPATGAVGLPNRVTLAGSLASSDISIRARDAVAFTGPITVAATNGLLVSVLNGPIDLTGAVSLTGLNALNLYAGAGAITGPNATLASNGNIGLFANGGIVLGAIDTAGVLNTIASDGSVTTAGSLVTPGSVTVTGQLAVRGGVANINSGGAITTGSILTTAGNDVLLTSVGAQSLGIVNAGRDLVVNAASLNAVSVTAQGNVNATVGGGITLGNTSAGNDVLLTSGGAQTLGATTAGRDLIVNAASLNAANVTAQRNVSVTVGGGITLGNTTAGNDVLLTSGGAQTLGATTAGRDIAINAASLNAASVTAQRNVSATVGNGITLGNTTAGNDVLLTSGGAQTLGSTTAGQDITVNAASLNATSVSAQRNVRATVGGGITLGTTTAGNDVLLTSGGAQTLGATTAGRDLIVNAASLNAANVTAQRNVSAMVGGGITLGNTTAGNDVLLTSGGAQTLGATTAGHDLIVNAASLNAISVSAQRNVSATVGGGIAIGSTTAGNDVLLTSGGAQTLGATTAGRDITTNAASLDMASANAFRNLSATINGNAIFGNIAVNQLTVRAGQNATFSGVNAATAIDVGANGHATFNGIANAPNITVRSGDISIGTSARLGTIGTTQNVLLANSASAQMTIGGSGVSSGYSLSDAEMARIFSNNIDIGWTGNSAFTGALASPPAGGFVQPSIIVGALNVSSRASNPAGNLATNGALSIRTPGTMQVVGAVALNGAGNANSLRLSAGQSLQIIAGQGSIAIRDGANGLAGTLNLDAVNIVAASASAIADLAGQTDPILINTRLGLNDGFINDVGILSANVVNLNAGSSIFVQNSGSSALFRDRRGITANAINISLINSSGLPGTNGLVIINGQITAAPGFATGLAAIPLLSINGVPSQTAAGFDTQSTMNGCQITAIAACRQRENPVSVTDDDINQRLNPDQIGNNQFPTALIEVKEFETFGYPPLIDEPVTGSGNDDLWPATCDPDDEQTCPTEPLPAPQ